MTGGLRLPEEAEAAAYFPGQEDQLHVHGYLWTGEKTAFDKESIRRPPPSVAPTATSPDEVQQRYREAVAEWRATDVPPIETALWLLKPRQLIQGTWDEPKKAAEWLGERLTEHAPRFASHHDQDPTRLTALTAYAAERLAQRGDCSLGFYLRGTLFLSMALVTCSPNHAESKLSCPFSEFPEGAVLLPHTSAAGSLGHVTCKTCKDLIAERNARRAHGDETGARAKDAALADHSRKHHTE
ncbi:hypothetical protein [Streptomyces sp. NPDC037389]|uniref:hypothetical protein n=1 Tax=Streptomyces sp. NPDC037389 TaxID=3155369 RepID=UPI0033FDA9CB